MNNIVTCGNNGKIISVGDRVDKVLGDYTFKGKVLSIFTKINKKQVRVVVENKQGILHIFNPIQLIRIEK